MISPGLAYAIAFRPHPLAVAHAHLELLGRVADRAGTDPRFRQAVESAFAAADTEYSAAAEDLADLTARAHDGGVELPAPPESEAEWAAWRTGLAERLRPLLADRHTELSFAAGAAAWELRVGWGRAHRLACLRAAAPDDPGLAREAAELADELPALARRLQEVLARVDRRLVDTKAAGLRNWLGRARRPDATSTPGWNSVHAFVAYWTETLDTILAAIGRALDVPLASVPTGDPGPEERRALADILATPLADGPRLRLAELAAQRGDPRAELIRLQFEIRDLRARGRLEGRRPTRVQELIGAHPEWTSPLTELGAHDVEFDRGFPWHVTIDTTAFLDRIAELFARAPIGSVRLTGGLAGRGAQLAARPELARLTALNLSEQGVTDADLAALARSDYLRELRFLNLNRNRITGQGVEALATSWDLPALTRVSLDFNPCDNPVDGLEYIDEIRQVRVPTEAGTALERRHGHLRWLHPDDGG